MAVPEAPVETEVREAAIQKASLEPSRTIIKDGTTIYSAIKTTWENRVDADLDFSEHRTTAVPSRIATEINAEIASEPAYLSAVNY